MRDRFPRAAILTLIHIHFEGFVDLVDRSWANCLDLSRAVFEPCGEHQHWLVDVPARLGGRGRTARHGRLLLRVIPDGEPRERSEALLLDAYLDLFLAGRTPDRLLAIHPESPPAQAGVRPRRIEDRLEGTPPYHLPYLEVALDGRIAGEWLAHRHKPASWRDLTSPPGAGNLRPFQTPFRREPPCNSVSSVYPSRERRRCSIP